MAYSLIIKFSDPTVNEEEVTAQISDELTAAFTDDDGSGGAFAASMNEAAADLGVTVLATVDADATLATIDEGIEVELTVSTAVPSVAPSTAAAEPPDSASPTMSPTSTTNGKRRESFVATASFIYVIVGGAAFIVILCAVSMQRMMANKKRQSSAGAKYGGAGEGGGGGLKKTAGAVTKKTGDSGGAEPDSSFSEDSNAGWDYKRAGFHKSKVAIDKNDSHQPKTLGLDDKLLEKNIDTDHLKQYTEISVFDRLNSGVTPASLSKFENKALTQKCNSLHQEGTAFEMNGDASGAIAKYDEVLALSRTDSGSSSARKQKFSRNSRRYATDIEIKAGSQLNVQSDDGSPKLRDV